MYKKIEEYIDNPQDGLAIENEEEFAQVQFYKINVLNEIARINNQLSSSDKEENLIWRKKAKLARKFKQKEKDLLNAAIMVYKSKLKRIQNIKEQEIRVKKFENNKVANKLKFDDINSLRIKAIEDRNKNPERTDFYKGYLSALEDISKRNKLGIVSTIESE
jgi:hypothetical protein